MADYRPIMICARCLHYGPTKRATKGSTAVEVALWLVFCFPGIIYSVWRRSDLKDVCAICSSPDLIPEGSERGRQILKELSEKREA